MGWIGDRTLAMTYDLLEPRQFRSPVFPSGKYDSRIDVVQCNARYSDCSALAKQIRAKPAFARDQFPEGEWPEHPSYNPR